MGAIGRILLIVVAIVLVVAVGGYFLLPSTASQTNSFTVERPASSVVARLASTPPGTVLAEGVTLQSASAVGNVVTAEVAYADGATGRVIYTVTEEGENSNVEVKLEEDLGPNPLNRVQALTGGDIGPIAEAATATISADLETLPSADFVGLPYEVVQVAAQPFFYIQNCAPTDADAVEDVVAQSLLAIRPIMARHNLREAGPPIAVEPRVETNQYCYQIGLPYSGTPPRVLAVGTAGVTPSGQALRMVYTGTEDDVMAQIYDRMDALLAAAHLDNPGTREDDWATYEVYHDDPTQPGGSRNREIFYVAGTADISRLTAIAPPSAVAAPAAAPAPTAAPAVVDPAATPAPTTPPAPTPAPAPATP